jgi:hypothetical protein
MDEKETNEATSVPRPSASDGSENRLYICGEMNKYKHQRKRKNDCAGCYHGIPHHFTGSCYISCNGTSIGEKAMCKPCDPNASSTGQEDRP